VGISIVVSDSVRFKVVGSMNGPDGKPQPFDFWLTARRLKDTADVQQHLDGLRASESKTPLTDALVGLLRDWSGVSDESGQPMPFSEDAARRLLDLPGMASLVHATYLREVGAKEKN
jgi:hypothetical protein